LSEVNPHAPGLRRGVEWLLKHRDPATHAWGERPDRAPTVTHSAHVLTALVDSGLARANRSVADAIGSGYAWLTEHLDPKSVHDNSARVESYNLSKDGPDGTALTWHSTVWHPGLPYAVSALIREPAGTRFDLLCRAIDTVVSKQLEDGRWPTADGAAAFSVWSVWPFLDALADFAVVPLVKRGDLLTLVTPGTLIAQREPDRNVSVARLLWRSRRGHLTRWPRRHWASLLLAIFVATGGLLVAVAGWDVLDFGLSLVVPVVLVFIQEAMARGRSSQ
jgi:hypothetical protein